MHRGRLKWSPGLIAGPEAFTRIFREYSQTRSELDFICHCENRSDEASIE